MFCTGVSLLCWIAMRPPVNPEPACGCGNPLTTSGHCLAVPKSGLKSEHIECALIAPTESGAIDGPLKRRSEQPRKSLA
jgi:hypothetical protein